MAARPPVEGLRRSRAHDRSPSRCERPSSCDAPGGARGGQAQVSIAFNAEPFGDLTLPVEDSLAVRRAASGDAALRQGSEPDPRDYQGAPGVPVAEHGRDAGPRGALLDRSRHHARQRRELHGRGAGAHRVRRTAAGQRRARPGRVLRPAGDHGRHARRVLQPRHEDAEPVGWRHLHGRGRLHAAGPRVRVRLGARGPRLPRLGQRTPGRDHARGGVDIERGEAAVHRHVPGEQVRLPALQLLDGRRRGPEHGGPGDLRGLFAGSSSRSTRSGSSTSSRTSPPTRRRRRST